MGSQPDTLDFVTVLAYIRYELTEIVAKCSNIENMKERTVMLISFIDTKESSFKDLGLPMDKHMLESYQNEQAIRIIKQEVMDDAYNEDTMEGGDSDDDYNGMGRLGHSGIHMMHWKVEKPGPEATVVLDSTEEDEDATWGRKRKRPRKSPKGKNLKKGRKPAAKSPMKVTSSSRQCDTCDKKFLTNSGLRKHLKIHSGLPTFTCSWCKRGFKRKEDLKLHLVRDGHINYADKNKDEDGILEEKELSKYIEKLLVCEFCDRLFDRQSAFKSHMKVHINEMPTEEGEESAIPKDLSDKTDNQARNEERREETDRGDGKQATAVGDEAGTVGLESEFRKQVSEKHFPSVQPKPVEISSGGHENDRMVCYRCPFCPFFCYQQNKMKEHEQTHTGERPFKCDICDKTFTLENMLQNHVKVHSGEKPHRCEYCGKCYSSQTELFTHEYHHTGVDRFKCKVCTATFTSKAGLGRHMNYHLGKRDHICDKCGKGFFAKSELTGHIRFHHKKKIYRHKCEICGKPFLSRGELNKHMTVHSEERPFMCAMCGKGFSRKTYLTKHMIIHTSEKPFKCSKCPKAFSFPSNLVTHERIHTGEKPYSCHICGKRSSDVANHIKHMKIHKKDTLTDQQYVPAFDHMKHMKAHKQKDTLPDQQFVPSFDPLNFSTMPGSSTPSHVSAPSHAPAPSHVSPPSHSSAPSLASLYGGNLGMYHHQSGLPYPDGGNRV